MLSRALLARVGLLFLAGCEERERLTFPTAGDGVGPVTMIDQPYHADTTVPAGRDFFVNGRTTDPDGVDTVYFLVLGGSQSFLPFVGGRDVDTVRFGLPITIAGRAGTTIQVQVYGVDALGNVGDTSSRRIVVQ